MTNEIILSQYKKTIQKREITQSVKTYKTATITRYVQSLDKHLRKTELGDVEKYLLKQKHLKTTSLNRLISQLKEFYHYLQQHDIIRISFAHMIKNRKVGKQLPRALSQSTIAALCTPLDDELPLNQLTNIRNQAIIEFLYSTGVRNMELITATVGQISPDLRYCWIKTRKGGNDRIVFLGKYARCFLYQYLTARRINCKDRGTSKNAPLFLSNYNRPMNKRTLTRIVKNLAIKRIGSPVTPHMIRHTFATDMLRGSSCLRTVQKMLGHTSVNSTIKYCHLSITDKQMAIQKHHPRAYLSK